MLNQHRIWITPICAGLIVLALTISLWQALSKREYSNAHEKTHTEAAKLISYIKTDLNDRELALQRMSSRWEARGGTPRKEFIEDSTRFIDDYPGFQSIEMIDKYFRMRWLAPPNMNGSSRNANIDIDEQQHQTLEETQESGTSTLSGPIQSPEDEKLIRFNIPLSSHDQPDGFIVATLQISTWLSHVLDIKAAGSERVDFKTEVFMDDTPIYKQQGYNNARHDLQATEDITLFKRNFYIHVSPTNVFFENNSDYIPETILIIGTLMSALIALIITLLQKTALDSKRTLATSDELRKITNTLTLATRAGEIGIWTWDTTSNKLTWNDIMYDIYGIPKGTTLVYEMWRDTVHPNDVIETEKMLKNSVLGQGAYDTKFRIVLPNGSIRHIQAAGAIERNANGVVQIVTGINFDITEQVVSAEELAHEKQKLDYIIKGTDVGTWEWNIQTGEVNINERWANIIGYTLAELSPVTLKTWETFCHPDDYEASAKLLEKNINGEIEYYDCEVRLKHKNGNWVWVHDRGKLATWTSDGKPVLMFGTHQDITERKKNEKKIYYQANYDMLTGLATRKLAEEQMSLLIAQANRNQKLIAVLFVDLDGFKFVNDNFGHEAGDTLLKEIGLRLLTCMRSSDIVARIGGDEFLVILPDLQSDEYAKQIAITIIDRVSSPVKLKNGIATISASIGIAIYPDDASNAQNLIKMADQAMYKIKHSGKNSYTFASEEN